MLDKIACFSFTLWPCKFTLEFSVNLQDTCWQYDISLDSSWQYKFLSQASTAITIFQIGFSLKCAGFSKILSFRLPLCNPQPKTAVVLLHSKFFLCLQPDTVLWNSAEEEQQEQLLSFRHRQQAAGRYKRDHGIRSSTRKFHWVPHHRLQEVSWCSRKSNPGFSGDDWRVCEKASWDAHRNSAGKLHCVGDSRKGDTWASHGALGLISCRDWTSFNWEKWKFTRIEAGCEFFANHPKENCVGKSSNSFEISALHMWFLAV